MVRNQDTKVACSSAQKKILSYVSSLETGGKGFMHMQRQGRSSLPRKTGALRDEIRRWTQLLQSQSHRLHILTWVPQAAVRDSVLNKVPDSSVKGFLWAIFA